MKVALALCLTLLSIVLVQAEDEMGPGERTRITFGTPATPGEFPYMAYIEADIQALIEHRICSGSLVTRSAVLTSASCVSARTKFRVRLGSIHRSGEDWNAWSVESTWAQSHPDFNWTSGDNDIAIIHLPRKAPLHDFIQLVHLSSSDDGSSYVGHTGIVSGWGFTSADSGTSDVLHWAEVEVIPNDYCRRAFPNLLISDRTLCAGTFTSTVYKDDYGAPLVLKTEEGYTQIGIFSRFASRHYNTPTPTFYTRVTSFIDWIELQTGSDS